MAHAAAMHTEDVMLPPPAREAGAGVYTEKLGMWIFLGSEVMFFTALIGTYVILRFAHPSCVEEPGRGAEHPGNGGEHVPSHLQQRDDGEGVRRRAGRTAPAASPLARRDVHHRRELRRRSGVRIHASHRERLRAAVKGCTARRSTR